MICIKENIYNKNILKVREKEATIEHMKIETDYDYIVAIGTSTGGPKALASVLSQVDQNLSATYIVVQHMPAGFTKSLADRLDGLSSLHVKEAENYDILQAGHAYIAPGGYQFKITNARRPEVLLTEEPPYKGHKPSVNVMLHTLAKLKVNKKLIVVIMTGMGSDGLEGLEYLKAAHEVKVIAQDESTSIVYGMPKAIVSAGYADYVVPLEMISATIKRIMGE